MSKLSGVTKTGKDLPIRASLHFLVHVKVKKLQDLEEKLQNESTKPHQPAATACTADIFTDRIEFIADKNAKKPIIKKIKFSQIERVISNEDALSVTIGRRQGKSGTVTSFGFNTEEGFNAFLLNLQNSLDSAKKSKDSIKVESKQENAPVRRDATLSQEKTDTMDLIESEAVRQLMSNSLSRSNNAPCKGKYATSYISWELPGTKSEPELISTDLHMPINGDPSSRENSEIEEKKQIKTEAVMEGSHPNDKVRIAEESTEDIRHCPCCLRRSGINLKLADRGPRAYAPSSADLPTHNDYPIQVSYTNNRNRRSNHPRRTLTEESSVEYEDEDTMLDTYDESDSTMVNHSKPRHRSLPPPIRYPRHIERPPPPRERYQPIHLPRRFLSKPPRSYQPSWTNMSSSSSGYTSATFHEDGLELTVDPSTAGQYIRNKKRIVTGRVRSEARRSPQIFFYRKNPTGLPRLAQM